jgi:F420-0:gamma-glutamyl ligase
MHTSCVEFEICVDFCQCIGGKTISEAMAIVKGFSSQQLPVVVIRKFDFSSFAAT